MDGVQRRGPAQHIPASETGVNGDSVVHVRFDHRRNGAQVLKRDSLQWHTLLDREANHQTLEIAPGCEPKLVGGRVATNHQAGSHWPLYEEKVLTHVRFQHLQNVVADREHTAWAFTREFLQFPLYHSRFARGFGTLYDAAFYPQRMSCEYFWPHNEWQFDFHSFTEREYPVIFVDPEGYPENSEAYGEIYTSKPIPVLQF